MLAHLGKAECERDVNHKPNSPGTLAEAPAPAHSSGRRLRCTPTPQPSQQRVRGAAATSATKTRALSLDYGRAHTVGKPGGGSRDASPASTKSEAIAATGSQGTAWGLGNWLPSQLSPPPTTVLGDSGDPDTEGYPVTQATIPTTMACFPLPRPHKETDRGRAQRFQRHK